MSQARSLMDLSVPATTAIAYGRLVNFAGGQLSAAGAKPMGVAKRAAIVGDRASLAVCGTAVVEAGGVIAVGDAVVSDAQGRVVVATPLSVTIAAGAVAVTSSAANGAITVTAGGEPPQFVVGDAMQPAGAAGAFIEILLRR